MILLDLKSFTPRETSESTADKAQGPWSLMGMLLIENLGRRSGWAAPEDLSPFTHPLVQSNVPVDPEDTASCGGLFLGATQGHGTWDSLTLYTGVHSAQDKMELRSLVKACLYYTICDELGPLENPNHSLNQGVYVFFSLLNFAHLNFVEYLLAPQLCHSSPPWTGTQDQPATSKSSSHWPPLVIILLFIPIQCLVYSHCSADWQL